MSNCRAHAGALIAVPEFLLLSGIHHCLLPVFCFTFPAPIRAESDPRILTNAETGAEAPTALNGSRAIPIIAATPRLEHTTIQRGAPRSSLSLDQSAQKALLTAMLHARGIHRDPRDGSIRLHPLARARAAPPTNQRAREPEPRARHSSPPWGAHSPSGAGFQRVKCFSICWSTWLKQRPITVSDRMPTYMFGIWKLYCA